jgi:hypothetical protein
MITAVAGKPGHTGAELGGPPGSWYMGLIVTNVGPGTFQSVPATQVSLVLTNGKSYAPKPLVSATTGEPATMAAGQQLRIILIFVLPKGAQPQTALYAPFGPGVAPLKWSL